MKRLRAYWLVALVFWLLIATYGLLLRWHLFRPMAGFRYTYWLHAHSHAAFLGWLHAGFMLMLTYALMPGRLEQKSFRNLFVFSQAMVAGMLISFPLQGYKGFSIAFLSLFLLGTYVWAFWFGKIPQETRRRFPLSYRLGRSAVWMMLLSGISPWMLGPVMVMLGKKSIWYNLDIYFYLHFQYNGWFFLGFLALVAYLFESKNVRFPDKFILRINRLLLCGVLMGYLTNTLWTQPPLWVNFLAMLSVFCEAAGLWLLFGKIWDEIKILHFNRIQKQMFYILLFGLVLKVIFQFTASCPYFAQLAYRIRDLIIGYLHWVFLGIYSVFLLWWADMQKIDRLRPLFFRLFFAGFVWMDMLIFARGFLIWWKISIPEAMASWIFWATAFMYTGISLIVYDGTRTLLRNTH